MRPAARCRARHPALAIAFCRAILSSCAGDAYAAGIDLDADALARAERHLLHVGALGTRQLGLGHRVDESPDVLDQLLVAEARLADAGLHDAGLLDPGLDRAALGALDRRGDVHGHGAE